ncbi:MAG: hypothetical protein IJ733_01085 [Lachnospiraceae bacterium]|nr:hypothetical protein [Lachnospiraceae bacterium]
MKKKIKYLAAAWLLVLAGSLSAGDRVAQADMTVSKVSYFRKAESMEKGGADDDTEEESTEEEAGTDDDAKEEDAQKSEKVDETKAKEKKAKEKKGILVRVGSKKRVIKVIKGSFFKKKGVKYFKKQNGKRVKRCFFAKGKSVYYAGKKGEIIKGWKKIKGHYYFFDRKSGKLQFDTKADRIRIRKDGIAKETKENVSRIKVYLEAQSVVSRVSKPSDSKAGKLYKCYKWMAAFGYTQYRTMKKAKAAYPNTWDIVFANDIFKKHRGCCASEASAFAYMAKVCGYEGVKICSDTGHAWVDIGGRLYDPLFAEARSFAKNYNARYSDYRIHPAYTKAL